MRNNVLVSGKHRKRLNEKGFTLLEILLGFTITAIVIAISTTAMLSMYKAVNTQARLGEDKLIADSLFATLSDQLQCASKVQVLEEPLQEEIKYNNVIRLTEGAVTLNDVALNTAELRRRAELQVQVDQSVLSLSLVLYDENDRVVYRNTGDFKVNVLSFNHKSIEAVQNTAMKNPVISFESDRTKESQLGMMANELYERMAAMKGFYFNLTVEERIRYKTLMDGTVSNDWWNGNNYFRTYLKMFLYDNAWPVVDPEEEPGFPKLPYAASATLYMQPYIYNPANPAIPAEVCVYISNYPANGNWNTMMIYSYSEQKWFYTTDSKKQISVANGESSWAMTRRQIEERGWLEYVS